MFGAFMKVKIGIWGGIGSGKSSLLAQLTPSIDEQQIITYIPKRTLQRPHNFDTVPMTMCFYDKPDRESNSQFWERKKVDISIYCIDSSHMLDERRIDKIKEDIAEFQKFIKKNNRNTRLIIALTKSDRAVDNAFETLRKAVLPIPTVATSVEDLEIEKLWEQLDTISIILKMENMRNQFPKQSNMYTLLDNFNCELQRLPFSTRVALASEVEILLNPTQESGVQKPIESFLKRCDEIVCGKYSTIENILISIAIAAAVFILAAFMGFFMGFSLGAWTGPGAFFTGLAVGGMSAVAVVAGAPLLGLSALGVSVHTLFKPLSVEIAYNEIAVEARALNS